MYPDRTWKSISRAAVECIQRCLVVQHDVRYSVDQALSDTWISDTQCSIDVANLEEKAIKQTLTGGFKMTLEHNTDTGHTINSFGKDNKIEIFWNIYFFSSKEQSKHNKVCKYFRNL